MKATVILQKCTYTQKLFGVRIQQMDDGEWYRTWAFPIEEASAKRERYDATKIMSILPADPEYPGCPYCGSKGSFYDSNCGKLACYRGESSITCPWCNMTYDDLGPIKEKVAFTGGDL